MNKTMTTMNPAETTELGIALGQCLKGGDVIALKGDLGAGKTALAKGIGNALKVNEPMTSPTFTLIQEYIAPIDDNTLRVIHMDLYRLRQPEEVEVIGVEDYFQADSICLIEWPEIAEDFLPEDYLEITIEGSGDLPRTLSFRAIHGDWEERLRELFQA